ncbi:hypothetical protein BCV71DRAFT_231072 [Rhizopus microsporus]|uniref:Uncharacterized protein n=1 Tax=Rhizopus microsporus TaxID=58291 RepID=A0A1X0SF87_RHIZD|nr:hypothetical protein BCV71DRAFT_231072 [Rhizopus microsporus]
MQEKEVYNVSLKYASVVSHKRFAFNYQYRLTSFYINDYSRLYMRKDVDVNEYVRIKVSIRNIITKNIFYINFGFFSKSIQLIFFKRSIKELVVIFVSSIANINQHVGEIKLREMFTAIVISKGSGERPDFHGGNIIFRRQWISKYNELVIVTFVELNHVFSFQIREYQLAPTNLKVFLGKLYSKRQNIRNMRIEIDHDTLPHR